MVIRALPWQIMSASHHNLISTPTSSVLKVGSMCSSKHSSKPFENACMCNIHTVWVVSHTVSMAKMIESGPEQLVCIIRTQSFYIWVQRITKSGVQISKQYKFVPIICYNCSIVAGCYITSSFRKVCPHTSGFKFRIRVAEANNCSVPKRWPP